MAPDIRDKSSIRFLGRHASHPVYTWLKRATLADCLSVRHSDLDLSAHHDTTVDVPRQNAPLFVEPRLTAPVALTIHSRYFARIYSQKDADPRRGDGESYDCKHQEGDGQSVSAAWDLSVGRRVGC